MIIKTLTGKQYELKTSNKDEILAQMSKLLKIPRERLTLYKDLLFTTNLKENPLKSSKKEELESNKQEEDPQLEKIKEKINSSNSISELNDLLTNEEMDFAYINLDEYLNIVFDKFFK